MKTFLGKDFDPIPPVLTLWMEGNKIAAIKQSMKNAVNELTAEVLSFDCMIQNGKFPVVMAVISPRNALVCTLL